MHPYMMLLWCHNTMLQMITCRNKAMPNIQSLVQAAERTIGRLISDMRKTESNLKRDVEDLERETSQPPGALKVRPTVLLFCWLVNLDAPKYLD